MKTGRMASVVLVMAMVSMGLAGAASAGAGEAAFGIDVHTRPRTAETSDPIVYLAIPGQICVFLVTAYDFEGVDDVTVSARTAPHFGGVVSIENPEIGAEGVAEVLFVPAREDAGQYVPLEITGRACGVEVTVTVYVNLIDYYDYIRGQAEAVRDSFVPWVAENYPEIGIDGSTAWTPTVVYPGILVVKHYMFLSDEWELYVMWHVMIPPYDFATAYLRHRYTDVSLSYAFKDFSVSDDVPWAQIDIPEEF